MAVIAFVPAIHTGYLSFFRKHEGTLYLLGEEIISQTSRAKYLERDLRMTNPQDVRSMLLSLNIVTDIQVLAIKDIAAISEKIVMPDDEISRELAETLLKGKDITFENVFLRWGKAITLQEQQIPVGRVISDAELDKELMGAAAAQTAKSSDWWRQIGAVVAKDGAVLFTAYNKRFPTDYTQDAYGDPRSNFDAGERYDLVSTIHAEAWLVAQAAKAGKALEGSSMYVTTFPCPTCAKSVVEAGIKKLYYRDGYSLLDAEKILSLAGVEIILVKAD